MKIFAFLYGFGFGHPTGVRKTCTATCTGETDKWATLWSYYYRYKILT